MSRLASLGNIDDVELWVGKVVMRKFATHVGAAGGDERAEMVAEGVALLYELYGKWDPEQCRDFAAYAYTMLPRRLTDWWRQEMRRRGIAYRSNNVWHQLDRVPFDTIDQPKIRRKEAA